MKRNNIVAILMATVMVMAIAVPAMAEGSVVDYGSSPFSYWHDVNNVLGNPDEQYAWIQTDGYAYITIDTCEMVSTGNVVVRTYISQLVGDYMGTFTVFGSADNSTWSELGSFYLPPDEPPADFTVSFAGQDVRYLKLYYDRGCPGADVWYVDSITVTRDITPPEISVSVTPDTLWPPDHKMDDITAAVTVSDNCDPAPTVVISSVSSNEPDDAIGDGDGSTVNDIQGADIGTEDYNFQLRAERDNEGDGRVYTITYTATDASGNSASASATVTVPHGMCS